VTKLAVLIRWNDRIECVGDFIVNGGKEVLDVSGEMVTSNMDVIGIFLYIETK
jgi:hypothetical protein